MSYVISIIMIINNIEDSMIKEIEKMLCKITDLSKNIQIFIKKKNMMKDFIYNIWRLKKNESVFKNKK